MSWTWAVSVALHLAAFAAAGFCLPAAPGWVAPEAPVVLSLSIDVNRPIMASSAPARDIFSAASTQADEGLAPPVPEDRQSRSERPAEPAPEESV
jgi:hypothetical protein